MSTEYGAQSQARKVGLIKALLAKCEGEETKFLIRSLEGKLRIGLAEKTVRPALALSLLLSFCGLLRMRPQGH